MQYQGFFRNTKDEQLYKVEIFTDGVLYTTHTVIADDRWYQLIDTPQTITLSGNPFIVEYQSDSNNIYKPYKSSTAEIGIVSGTINPQLLNNSKCKVLVRLMKWKNEVVLSPDGGIYTNTITNETFAKSVIRASIHGVWEIIYNEFNPRVEDEFCWEIEWVGYATPNSYNQPFERLVEEFTLEAQDSLSCLRYYDYPTNNVGVSTITESIFNSLSLLPNNQIQNIYITNSINLPDETLTAITDKLKSQNNNWVDEDGEWDDCLSVIEQLMMYLNCTLIQWKDSLYITTPDAIRNRRQYYYKHNIDGTVTPMQLVDGELDITDTELGANGTNISTTSTYKKVSVETNEYYDDNLIPTLSDTNESLNEISRWDRAVSYINIKDVDRNILSDKHPYNYDVDNANALFSGSVYEYVPDLSKNEATIVRYTYPRDTADSEDWFAIKHENIISNPTTWNDIFWSVGCTPIEFGANEISTDDAMADYYRSYNGKKVWLFHSPSPQVLAARTGFAISPLITYYLNHTSESRQNSNKVIEFNTRKTLLQSGQSLQILGNLTFYQNITLPLQSGWAVDVLKAYKPYMYIWMRISININGTTYYCKNISSGVSGTYEWSTTNKWCKIWYDNFAGIEKINRKNKEYTKSNAFETEFSFTKNTRGADGTCIQLPTELGEGIYDSIKIEIARPFGCGKEKKVSGVDQIHLYAPQYTVLDGFEIHVIDNEETNFRYIENTNNEFYGTMSNEAVDDYSNLSLKVSSNYHKNTSKATILGIRDRLNNEAAGVNSYPECNVINNIIKTYKDSHVILNITLPDEITPFTLVKWSSQMGDKKFIVDGLGIDYAYSDYTCSLMEKELSELTPQIYSQKKTRNFRRNGDNLTSPLPRKNKTEVNMSTVDLLPPQLSVNSNSGNVFVNGGSLSFTNFETVIKDCDMIYSTPDYLYNNVSPIINSNGELILNYNEN